MNDRAAEQKVVRTTRHFINVSNQDSNDYGTPFHNPGQMYISMGNSGITNIQSFNDQTQTTLTPISFVADITYNNVSNSFQNNKFRLSSITANASPALALNTIGEDVAPITVTVPDGLYRTGAELATALQTALNTAPIGWLDGAGGQVDITFGVAFSAVTNSLTFSYATNAPGNIPANPIVVLTTAFTEGGVAYDSSRIWGTTYSSIAGINVSGTFQIPYANRVAGLSLPNYIDLQTLQVLRIHSNIAKRTFAKRGSSTDTPAQRILSVTDILFEIPLESSLGSTLFYQPSDNRFMQDVASNFDELRLTITDNRDRVVNFTQAAEINFTFAIEREVIVPDNEARIKALSEYNKFRSY